MKNFTKQLIAATFTCSSFASVYPYIVAGKDMFQTGEKSLSSVEILSEDKETQTVIARASVFHKGALSNVAHQDHFRCGGYFAFETEEQAKAFVKSSKENDPTNITFADYSLDQEELVTQMMEQADEFSIRSTILKLSSFKNRYYKSKTGVESQNWLKSHWEQLTSHRNDIKVELFDHSSYPQPSVVATIEGESSDIIVIGGHADSISGWWGRERATAPGADDNASGTSTVTETLKVLANTNYKPKNTIMFMAYAAEEVGLLGSKDIATQFKRAGKNVIGVLQLDMTNFNNSSDDITLITDNTNQAQNDFLGSLIDKYQPELTWGRDKCGYGCSDHASWHAQGYPASIPFETRKRDMNSKIHTANDTLAHMGGTADHALKFAKLALAYTIELDR